MARVSVAPDYLRLDHSPSALRSGKFPITHRPVVPFACLPSSLPVSTPPSSTPPPFPLRPPLTTPPKPGPGFVHREVLHSQVACAQPLLYRSNTSDFVRLLLLISLVTRPTIGRRRRRENSGTGLRLRDTAVTLHNKNNTTSIGRKKSLRVVNAVTGALTHELQYSLAAALVLRASLPTLPTASTSASRSQHHVGFRAARPKQLRPQLLASGSYTARARICFESSQPE